MEDNKNNIFMRYEMKYILDGKQKKDLEEVMADRMTEDPHGHSTICNIYFDTPDYRLIRSSLESPVYKEKLRFRSYGKTDGDDPVFVEIKKKYQGIVYKRRIMTDEKEASSYIKGEGELDLDSQIGREIDYLFRFYEDLEPKVYLSYERDAYFSSDDPDLRMTIDSNIRYRQDDLDLSKDPGGEKLMDDDTYLLEVKTSTAMPLWLVRVLSRDGIRKQSFSKYGAAYMKIRDEKLMKGRI